MAILKDMRTAQTGFMQINNMQSDGTDNYNPRIAGQSRYFSYLTGYRSRIGARVLNGEVVKFFNLPKVAGTPLSFVRSECVGDYEPLGVERWYVQDIMLPAGFQRSDSTYTIVMQVHEELQPGGERTPPWHLAVLERTTEPAGFFTLELSLSHDNGTGASGGATLPTVVYSAKKLMAFGAFFKVSVKSKISGSVNDYLQLYINDDLIMDYSGYVGYPAAGNNYLKYGLYSYQPTDPEIQFLQSFSRGCLVLDGGETFETAKSAYNTPLPKPEFSADSVAVAVVGDNNVAGANIAGAQGSSNKWAVNDPVQPFGKNCSILPAIADIQTRPVQAFNFGVDGASIASLPGRAVPFQAGVKVSTGDVVLPSTVRGATGLLPLGFAFRVRNSGTLPASEPVWNVAPTAANPFVDTTSGGITFTATPRYTSTVGQFVSDSVNFDQSFALHEARTALALSGASRRVVILNAGTLDITNGTGSISAAAAQQIKAFFIADDCEVVTFSPINVTDPDILAALAPVSVNLSEAGTIDTAGGFITVLGVSQAGRFISSRFTL